MKATLEFNLPEEKHEFEYACSGNDWAQLVVQLDNHLRNKIKHAPDSMSEDTYNALKETRNEIHKLLENYNLKLSI